MRTECISLIKFADHQLCPVSAAIKQIVFRIEREKNPEPFFPKKNQGLTIILQLQRAIVDLV